MLSKDIIFAGLIFGIVFWLIILVIKNDLVPQIRLHFRIVKDKKMMTLLNSILELAYAAKTPEEMRNITKHDLYAKALSTAQYMVIGNDSHDYSFNREKEDRLAMIEVIIPHGGVDSALLPLLIAHCEQRQIISPNAFACQLYVSYLNEHPEICREKISDETILSLFECVLNNKIHDGWQWHIDIDLFMKAINQFAAHQEWSEAIWATGDVYKILLLMHSPQILRGQLQRVIDLSATFTPRERYSLLWQLMHSDCQENDILAYFNSLSKQEKIEDFYMLLHSEADKKSMLIAEFYQLLEDTDLKIFERVLDKHLDDQRWLNRNPTMGVAVNIPALNDGRRKTFEKANAELGTLLKKMNNDSPEDELIDFFASLPTEEKVVKYEALLKLGIACQTSTMVKFYKLLGDVDRKIINNIISNYIRNQGWFTYNCMERPLFH